MLLEQEAVRFIGREGLEGSGVISNIGLRWELLITKETQRLVYLAYEFSLLNRKLYICIVHSHNYELRLKGARLFRKSVRSIK